MQDSEKKLLIIGFGNQAKSWALNLRDSGWQVDIALRENSGSFEVCKKLNFEAITLNKINFKNYSYYALLTPDHTHPEVLSQLEPNLKIILAHGYSYTYNKNQLPTNTYLLLAPKAIASELRFQYETKGKLGAVYSIENSKTGAENGDENFLKILAKDLGITSGPYPTTFREETNADLFSEQSILCGIIPYIGQMSYELLRKNGVSKEVAYFECWYEVKLIVDTLIKLGPLEFFKLISPNALLGSEKGRKFLMDEHFQKNQQKLLEDILSGKFSKEVEKENFSEVKKQVEQYWLNSEITQTHNELKRELFN